MSIPSCILPQRDPYPLVTGPATGQPSCPLEHGCGCGRRPSPRRAAATLGGGDRAASAALSAARPVRLGDEGGAILPHLRERARLRTLGGGERVVGGDDLSRVARCSSVREAISASEPGGSMRAAWVVARVPFELGPRVSKVQAIRSSWRPIRFRRSRLSSRSENEARPEREGDEVG